MADWWKPINNKKTNTKRPSIKNNKKVDVKSFWKLKTKSIKPFKPFSISPIRRLDKYPARTTKEWKLIDSKPTGDKDKDKLMNWFDCRPLNKKKQGFNHQYSFSSTDNKIKTVQMSPKNFLKETYREYKIRSEEPKFIPYEQYEKEALHHDTPYGIQKLKEMGTIIKSKEKKLPMPFLEYDERGLPIGHEGRHTAKAAELQGIKTIPVTITKRRKSRYDDDDFMDRNANKPVRPSLQYNYHKEEFYRIKDKEDKEKPEVLTALPEKYPHGSKNNTVKKTKETDKYYWSDSGWIDKDTDKKKVVAYMDNFQEELRKRNDEEDLGIPEEQIQAHIDKELSKINKKINKEYGPYDPEEPEEVPEPEYRDYDPDYDKEYDPDMESDTIKESKDSDELKQ